MKLTIFLLLVFLLMGISSEPLWQEKKVANRESVHDFGLKENDPLDFPIPDLIETPDKSLDPKPNDLNAKKLKATLGSKFDANFMRISFPQSQKGQRGRELVDFSFKRNKAGRLLPVGDFPTSIINMYLDSIHLPNGTRLETNISDKPKKKLQQSIWSFTACLVVYRWKDLGIRFWPRYLKEGQCVDGKASCSIPAGMICRPEETTYKTLLRWFCPSAPRNGHSLLKNAPSSSAVTAPSMNYLLATAHNGSSTHGNCNWINAAYPVITQCKCSCPTVGTNEN